MLAARSFLGPADDSRARSVAGPDEARAKREMSLPSIAALLNQDIADAKAVQVRGTPTFFVNGKPYLLSVAASSKNWSAAKL